VGVADVDHGFEDGVPCVGFFQRGVWEHAAVPADVFDAAVGGVLEPVAGAFCDVEFAIRVIGGAVFAGLVVVTGTVHFAVVLSDVEIDGPRAELVGHLLVSGPEFLIAVAFLQQRVLGCVVAERIKIGVCEVGLEAKGFGHAYAFEHVEHILPAVHSGPADFTLGGEAFAVAGGYLCGLFKRFHNSGGVSC